jgi:hypothetical protein
MGGFGKFSTTLSTAGGGLGGPALITAGLLESAAPGMVITKASLLEALLVVALIGLSFTMTCLAGNSWCSLSVDGLAKDLFRFAMRGVVLRLALLVASCFFIFGIMIGFVMIIFGSTAAVATSCFSLELVLNFDAISTHPWLSFGV